MLLLSPSYTGKQAQRHYPGSHSQLMVEPGFKPRQPRPDLAPVYHSIPPLIKRKRIRMSTRCVTAEPNLEIWSKLCH